MVHDNSRLVYAGDKPYNGTTTVTKIKYQIFQQLS